MGVVTGVDDRRARSPGRVFPTAAQAGGLDLIGRSDLGVAGLNGEVAVLGNTAICPGGSPRAQTAKQVPASP